MTGQNTDDARIALMTSPDADTAVRIVQALVEERIIACGNIMPGLTSIYHWQGKVERDAEVLLILKTTAARLSDLLRRAPELHPYDVPEVLVLPVQTGHPPYLAWLDRSVQPDKE